MKKLQLEQMTKIAKNRLILLCQNGFLKNESEINAFVLMLSAIHFSPKYENFNAKIAEQNIEKEQIELINNAIEMFPTGERFLTFFKFYSGSGNIDLVKPKNVWNVIRAINERDTKNFSKLYAGRTPTSSKQHYRKNGNRSQRVRTFNKTKDYNNS